MNKLSRPYCRSVALEIMIYCPSQALTVEIQAAEEGLAVDSCDIIVDTLLIQLFRFFGVTDEVMVAVR